MERAVGEDEIADKDAPPMVGPPTERKRKRAPTVIGAGDDAPLPSPHVAYLTTAPVRRRPAEQEDPASRYYGFHLAGADRLNGSNGDAAASATAPMRSLAGWKHLGTEYVNTCNGVLLLASKGFSDPCRCTLWNPAIANDPRKATLYSPPPEKRSEPVVFSDDDDDDDDEEDEDDDDDSSIEIATRTEFQALGLGYGRRSKTYKLLVCCKVKSRLTRFWDHFQYSLAVHSLGSGDKETLPLRVVLSMETILSYLNEVEEGGIIKTKSLYMDGTIYILFLNKKILHAFDVDDETVHTIDMPGDRRKAKYQLIEMSDQRPCLVVIERHCIALWMLTEDYQLEPIHVIPYEMTRLYLCSIACVWDCDSVLVLLLNCRSNTDMLLLYDVTAKKIFRADLPADLTVEKSDYMLCWGYRPTLVSPGSIVGELSQDMERRQGRSASIIHAIDPLIMQDMRKGQKATLNIMCLMEFLVRIMQKLPDEMQDVVEMPSIDSEEPDFLFENVV